MPDVRPLGWRHGDGVDTSTRGSRTGLFLVELRAGPGTDDVSDVCQAFQHAVTRLQNAGAVVRWCGALHLPERARCLCLLEAADRASAVLARDTAGLPTASILPAFWVGVPLVHPTTPV
jgi:hypothetical protein